MNSSFHKRNASWKSDKNPIINQNFARYICLETNGCFSLELFTNLLPNINILSAGNLLKIT